MRNYDAYTKIVGLSLVTTLGLSACGGSGENATLSDTPNATGGWDEVSPGHFRAYGARQDAIFSCDGADLAVGPLGDERKTPNHPVCSDGELTVQDLNNHIYFAD